MMNFDNIPTGSPLDNMLLDGNILLRHTVPWHTQLKKIKKNYARIENLLQEE